jgi:hypothetical protein
MKGEIRDIRSLHRTLERGTEISIRLPILLAKDSARRFDFNRLQSMGQHSIHRNTTALAIFGICRSHRNEPSLKINILPAQR